MGAKMQHQVVLGLAGIGTNMTLVLAVLVVNAHVVVQTGLLATHVGTMRARVEEHRPRVRVLVTVDEKAMLLSNVILSERYW